MRYSR